MVEEPSIGLYSLEVRSLPLLSEALALVAPTAATPTALDPRLTEEPAFCELSPPSTLESLLPSSLTMLLPIDVRGP